MLSLYWYMGLALSCLKTCSAAQVDELSEATLSSRSQRCPERADQIATLDRPSYLRKALYRAAARMTGLACRRKETMQCRDGWARMAGVDALEISTRATMTSIFPTSCQFSHELNDYSSRDTDVYSSATVLNCMKSLDHSYSEGCVVIDPRILLQGDIAKMFVPH